MNAAGGARGLRLDEIAREIPGRAEVVGDATVRAAGVRQDSRAVEAGDLFVVRRGHHADGATFVRDAVARGAVAILTERGAALPAESSVPSVLVDDVADGLAYAAAAVYGHPSFTLEVVGITGTNGKTTTTHLVRAAIDGALGGAHCGVIGTVGHAFAGETREASHTTPEADEVARIMASMRARGASHVAMEVSSHALVLGRVRAVRFRVAAFTNLTLDHLDFHGTLEAYADAKAQLFTGCGPGSAVLNVDDPFGARLAAVARCPLVRCSAKPGTDVEIVPRLVDVSGRGIRAVVKTPAGDVDLDSRLVGRHNLENLLLALGIAHALEIDLGRAAAALSREGVVPGRLERCDADGDEVIVVVDYAHTPDALGRVLEAVRSAAAGRVWCIFGCGGDRDVTKRAIMGDAVARRSDVAILTSDNPRTEDPRAIVDRIEEGVRGAGLTETDVEALARGARGYVVELDCARAIHAAVLAAAPGDLVLVAGKGHEPYQIIGTEKRPLDDRVEARRALAERRARGAA